MEEICHLKYEITSEFGEAPVKGSPGSVGYDLKSAVNITIPAHDRKLVSTDLRLKFPKNTYGRIAPRSGLALLDKISVDAGVLDPDYEGVVQILLCNFSETDYQVVR